MKRTKQIALIILAAFFILVGLIGLVLPVLQGILFLAIGFLIISFCFPQTRPWLDKHTEKYPHIHSTLKKVETWIEKIIGDIKKF